MQKIVLRILITAVVVIGWIFIRPLFVSKTQLQSESPSQVPFPPDREPKQKFDRWNGIESIADYAKRQKLPLTKRVEMGAGIVLDLTLIPAGQFNMGSVPSEDGSDKTEYPQHEVVISRPFYLGQYEITEEQYKAIMDKYTNESLGPRFPVVAVSWNRATKFCALLKEKTGLGFRLPTEAEWEFACRAGKTTPFNVGKILDSTQANMRVTYQEKLVAVGTYKPNVWGLYDMHGNVMEWCQDFYDPTYYKSSPTQDPVGPTYSTDEYGNRAAADDEYHPLRGGCWTSTPSECRSAYRMRYGAAIPHDKSGFRVMLPVAYVTD